MPRISKPKPMAIVSARRGRTELAVEATDPEDNGGEEVVNLLEGSDTTIEKLADDGAYGRYYRAKEYPEIHGYRKLKIAELIRGSDFFIDLSDGRPASSSDPNRLRLMSELTGGYGTSIFSSKNGKTMWKYLWAYRKEGYTLPGNALYSKPLTLP